MKKRQFLKAAGTIGGASVLGALPFSTLAQLVQASFANEGPTTGNARGIEDGFMIGLNRGAGRVGYGFIFTVGSLGSTGKLMDNDDEVQPIFARRLQDVRVTGPTGTAVYLWIECDPTTLDPLDDAMVVAPNDDWESSVFVRLSTGRRDPEILKRAISANQVAKAAVGAMAVEFTSQMTAQLIGTFCTVYIPRWGKALIDKLAGEEGQATTATIARWVETGVGLASTLASAAYTGYVSYGMAKWMYQNPHRVTTPMGTLGILLHFGPPILSLISAALPHIPRNQPDKVIPPNIAGIWAASYGRSAAQNILKDLVPGIEVPPVFEVINSNSQLVITFDLPQFGTKVLVAFVYYGVTYGIGAATDYLNALDIFKNSEVLGVFMKSTTSATGEAIDGAVSAVANSLLLSNAKYTYNDDTTLSKALENSRNLYTSFAGYAFHREVGSRVLNINTAFINYFMDHDTDLSFYGVSAASNVANALASFRKAWLLMADTALHPTTSSTPRYGSPEGAPVASISYRAVAPADDVHITAIGIDTYVQVFPIRTDRDQVTTVTVEMPVETAPSGM